MPRGEFHLRIFAEWLWFAGDSARLLVNVTRLSLWSFSPEYLCPPLLPVR